MTSPVSQAPAALAAQDAEHLKLLSIFHYVVAGFAGLFSLMPGMYVAMGVALLKGGFDNSARNGPPPAMGWFLIGMGGVMMAVGLTFTACLVLAGRWLAARTHYTFCFVLACLSTPFFPFGTALGVFTILVLSREAVKRAFPPQRVA